MRKLPLAAVSTVLGLALAIGSIAPYVFAPDAEAAGSGAKKATAKKSRAKAPAKPAKAATASTKSCGTFFYRKDGQCVDARAKAK